MLSKFYVGKLRHSRGEPRHTFQYDYWGIYLHLDEVETICNLSPFVSKERFNLLSFYRQDYLPGNTELKDIIHRKIREETGSVFQGEIYLLATWRQLGFAMNPLSLFFCFNPNGDLEHVIAEVHNTPWNERHIYTLSSKNTARESLSESSSDTRDKWQIRKAFHVSPFMPMGMQYHWLVEQSKEQLTIKLHATEADQERFSVSLKLNEVEVTRKSLHRLLGQYGWQSVSTIYRIYIQALHLWRKSAVFYPHPNSKIQEFLVKADVRSSLFRSSGTRKVELIVSLFARRLVHKHFRRMVQGEIILVDNNISYTFGVPSCNEKCHIYINDRNAYLKIAMGGAIGAAEGFIDGNWTTDDLTLLIRLLLRNRPVLDSMQVDLPSFKKLAFKLFHYLNRDSIKGSKKNIAAHYDLGNEFFKLFLDPTMSYSSGIFDSASQSMEQASINKIERLCNKLSLTSSDSLLEIGSGWGALAIHAATHYGCHVTTTTISEEQYKFVTTKVKALHLEDQITVLKEDYRSLTGQFDKLVSVEMIEAVGFEYLPGFFKKCSSLLKSDGEMILQTITIADEHFERAKRSVDFIQRYIFPGGALPSVNALTLAATQHSDLRSCEVEDITEHYAVTVNKWRQRFVKNIDQIKAINFDQRFLRMWEYYFSYCEGGFQERVIGCIQIRFHQPEFRNTELME
ncbi:MAG: DUF1365 family protein [Gammaproteobacteria bacterium]|nr:DUF1365 family protein [Gammaproteobacteria bacterium]